MTDKCIKRLLDKAYGWFTNPQHKDDILDVLAEVAYLKDRNQYLQGVLDQITEELKPLAEGEFD